MTIKDGDGVLEQVRAAWDTVRAIEPARGSTDRAQVQAVRTALEAMAAATGEAAMAAMPEEDRDDAANAIAAVYARAAAVAIAAGDEVTGCVWLVEAAQRSHDDDQRAELAAAQRSPERYRALVHGRNLMGRGDSDGAHALWKTVAKGEDDVLARAAKDALKAPRPLDGASPTLWQWNGCGLGFYGSRDRWSDGSYATTHCFTLAWVPLIPVGAYRVQAVDGGYVVMAREVLSGFAKIARLVVIAAFVLGIGGFAVHSYLTNPDRLAGQRFDAAIAAASGQDPEGALRRLDAALGGADFRRVSVDRKGRAGAAVVTLTAGLVPKPFTATALDQATRVVRRFDALPADARSWRAAQAMLDALDGWIAAVPDDPDTRLVLLREAFTVARDGNNTARADALGAQITATRLALAAAKAEAWPLDALALLVEAPTDPTTIAAAGQLLEPLIEAPSLLDDASADVGAWLVAAAPDDPLRPRVTDARDRGTAGRVEAEQEGITVKQLTAMQAARPWDQRVGLALAHHELGAGKLAEAAARLRTFGAPGRLIRDARFVLGQIAAAQGQLAEADEILSGLLASRLPRFVAADAALTAATRAVQERIEGKLRSGDVPQALRSKLESTSLSDGEKRDAVSAWFNEAVEADAVVQARRPAYQALGDVVPVSLAAGSVKLRRAQALEGPARDAMLQAAERTFLAIRTQAEGQPEFHLGLGEIYARLGKAEESEAELTALIARGDPKLSLAVSRVYRDIGSVERSKQVASDVHAKASSPEKEQAAIQLALLTANDEDESERWLRAADPTDPFVRVSLLEIEGGRLYRQGSYDACAAKFAESAQAHLAMATVSNLAGYNNAALADQRRFYCTGDPAALRDAEATLEKAYRARADEPIVVANLASMVARHATIRILAKRIDVRALKLAGSSADELIDALIGHGEREAILADHAADPGWRRSADLLAQSEVLAPSDTRPYEELFARARARRDATAAAAVVERMKRAKALDTSAAATMRTRWQSGAMDAKALESSATTIAHMTEVAARPRVDARTRAAALYLAGSARAFVGLMKSEPATIARARDELVTAMKLWPALDANAEVMGTLLDEAALGTADAARWIALRRTKRAATALADAAAPLVAAIRASPLWSQVLGFARADQSPRGVADIRMARLLGDPDLTARANAVFDDPLVRLGLELALLADPTAPELAADLAILDRR